MIKALWFGAKIACLIALAVWIADRPGTVRIVWLDYTFTIQLGFFLLLITGGMLLAIFFYQLIKTLVEFPATWRRYAQKQTRDKGYAALTLGLTAVAAGDTITAQKQATKAAKYLPQNMPLSLLLQAQAARLEGREDVAHQKFLSLLEDKNAAFLGVRGLLQTALEQEDYPVALSLAEKALALHPKQGWILKMAYDLSLRVQKWPEAFDLLKRIEKCGGMPPPEITSDKIALILLQAAQDARAGLAAQALGKIKKAYHLDPAFAPSSILLAEHYRQKGQIRKACATIEKTWKTAPHAALIPVWTSLMPEKKKGNLLARLSWLERLMKSNDTCASGLMETGKAALQGGIYGVARNYLEQAETLEKTQTLYRLFAELEEKTTGREDLVKHWLEEAAHAPPDKTWVCRQTGRTYDTWSPMALPEACFNTITWDSPETYRTIAVSHPFLP